MNSLSDVNALRLMIFIRYLVCCNEILRNDVSVSRGDVKFVNVPNRNGHALTSKFDNK